MAESLQPRLLEAPAEFNNILNLIEASLSASGTSENHQMVLKRCLLYLKPLNGRHWFCDPFINPMASHTLILFSFPNDSFTEWIRPSIASCITQCPDCAVGFGNAKFALYSTFVVKRSIEISKVKQVLAVISSWQLGLVKERIHQFANAVPSSLPPDELKLLAHICLVDPDIWTDLPEVAKDVHKLVHLIHAPERLENDYKLLAGTIYLLVEGPSSIAEVIQRVLESKQKDAVVWSIDHPNDLIISQFSKYFYRVQNSKFYSEELCVKFWKVCIVLQHYMESTYLTDKFLSPVDKNQMSQQDGVMYLPLISVLLNQLRASVSQPLPYILGFFGTFLEKLGPIIWSTMMPAVPGDVLDLILNNKFFRLFILRNDSELVGQCLSWLLPFCKTLTGSSRITAVCKIGRFLFQLDFNPKLEKDIKVFEVLCSVLDFCLDSLDINSENFELDVLGRRDIRALIDLHAPTFKLFVENVNNDHSMYRLLNNCFQFDIMILSSGTTMLASKKQPKVYDSFPILWSTVSLIPMSNSTLVFGIFSSLRYACKVVEFTPKKVTDPKDQVLTASFKAHNQQVVIITAKINSILEKIGMGEPSFIQEIFKNPVSMDGLWSCLFSQTLSQNALDIVYQAFDVEGRYEGIKALFKGYLDTSLKGVISSVRYLTSLEAFEPCKKLVRFLMDVIGILAEPINDIFSGRESDAGIKSLIRDIWACCWSFLVMLYKKTLQWATLYHSESLVEFTRDTLDLSHFLIDSSGIFLDFVRDEDASKQFTLQVLNVFESIIVWLRLGDMSLLSSCVSLVLKGIELAKDNHLEIKKDIVVSLVKYGVKARKYNNKLTQQQRNSIIAEVKSLDPELVKETIINFSPTRSEDSSSRSSTPKPDNAKTSWSSQTNKSKQMTLSNFGMVSKSPSVEPDVEVKEVPMSTLDILRNELKSQRQTVVPHKTNTIAPAPPRPAGFNSKKVVVGRSLNSLKKRHGSDSSEDEDMDDDGVDTTDLFVDKKKAKPRVVEIGIDGKPITKIASSARRIDRQQIEQQRMQMRLNVDLKGLYYRILKWNFNSTEYPDKDFFPSKPTANTYEDVKDYVNNVEPLLMLECWAGIQSCKDRNDEKPFDVFLGTRLSCDGFFDLICTIKKAEIADRKLTETDLIVLTAADESIPQESNKRYLKLPSTVTCLGKIKQIKSFNQEVADVTIRVASSGPMLSFLTPKSSLVGIKVMPMVTLEREYSSLKGLMYYDLCPEILKATPALPAKNTDSELEEVIKTYKVNRSQANAILGTQQAHGFSLIQGPPGTGKTKTILGIVGYSLEDTSGTASAVMVRTGPAKISKDQKVLICAPSNAAVDELVLRLKEGVINSSGKLISPSVVRLGRSDAVNSAVREFTLEELVERRLAEKNLPDPKRDGALKQEHIKLTAERRVLIESKRKPGLDDSEQEKIEAKIREITKTRNKISQQLDTERERATIAHRTKEIERRQIQEGILNNAQIICSTLSGSAHDFLSGLSIKFDKVIIDEACQCVELSAIIPLRYGCQQCIMVGDPNQLPPTVLSQEATRYSYDQSLFVRMQSTYPESVYLLDVQYRMHPQIAAFPSKNFYDGKLKDGDGMLEKNSRPWHNLFPLSAYRFFDIVGSQRQNEFSKSLFNTAEATVALEMVEELMHILPDKQFSGSIGIISPYKEQIKVLKRTFTRKFGDLILNEIDFNTVDGFQGQEKDIIIMSCVRANEAGGVGFLSDVRRMNVALTRAKSSLWILGNAASLTRNKNWKNLIEDARSRQEVTKAYPGFLKKELVNVSQINTPARSNNEPQDFSVKPAETNKKRQSDGSEKSKKKLKKVSFVEPNTEANTSLESNDSNDTEGSSRMSEYQASSESIKLKKSFSQWKSDHKNPQQNQTDAQNTGDNSDVPREPKGYGNKSNASGPQGLGNDYNNHINSSTNNGQDKKPLPTSSGTLPPKPGGKYNPKKNKGSSIFIKRRRD
ncbi:DEAD-box type RNA helicase [Yamadazyma tenuis]|uniref:DEAD-box type RNA helicase n=1 Tax=Candida tenuis TaxID=2315449 RepID=UPI00279A38CD|nr:DEAD-box type RNA helicase [Yamadazyma tenuis]